MLNLEILRKKIQEEYNNFVLQNSKLSNEELIDEFWSNEIVKYNENNIGNEVGFIINNHRVEIIKY